MTSPVLVGLACRHEGLLTRGYIFRAAFDFESAATSFAYEPHKDGRHYSAFTKRRSDPPRIHTASRPPSSAVVRDARRPTCRFIVPTSWGCTTVPLVWSNWIVLTTRPPSNLPGGSSTAMTSSYGRWIGLSPGSTPGRDRCAGNERERASARRHRYLPAGAFGAGQGGVGISDGGDAGADV